VRALSSPLAACLTSLSLFPIEELHHASSFYLLLGSQHFVAIGEYGLIILLMLLSLALPFAQTASRCITQLQRLQLDGATATATVAASCCCWCQALLWLLLVVLGAGLGSLSFSHLLFWYVLCYPVALVAIHCYDDSGAGLLLLLVVAAVLPAGWCWTS
jgi:hypothetical protein